MLVREGPSETGALAVRCKVVQVCHLGILTLNLSLYKNIYKKNTELNFINFCSFMLRNFYYGSRALVGLGIIHEVPRLHSIRHATFEWGFSGRVIGPTQRSFLDITQQSQKADINVSGGGFEPEIPASEQQ